MPDRRQLEQAIAVQESLRGTIDDAILDATINALRAQWMADQNKQTQYRVRAIRSY